MSNNNKKILITYGSFDVFHHGHSNLLNRANKYSDNIFVGLSTNKFNKLKGKKMHDSYRKRKKELLKFDFVKKVFKEKNWDQKINDIKKYNADIFLMGNDWEGKFDYLKDYDVEVIYLPRTEGVSSTQLRKEKLIEKAK